MADGWEQVDGLTTARSYAEDVKSSLEDPQAYWPAAQAAAAGGRDSTEVEEAHHEVLSLEATHWLPDSYASACGGCHLQFIPLRRLKHHCRSGLLKRGDV